MGQSLLQNGLFQRGKVTVREWLPPLLDEKSRRSLNGIGIG